MKTIFFILAFASTALAGGGNLSDGLSKAIGDSLYVNSPTESAAQTFEGVTQFGSGTTKSTFTATGTLQMGNRTQAIGYLPVFASSASLGAESIDITTSKICVSTMAAATLFGGRPLDMAGHVNISVSGATATITKTIELNTVVIETDVVDFPAISTGALVPLFHFNTSIAGSNTFRVCMTKTGAGTVTVTDFKWRVAEW